MSIRNEEKAYDLAQYYEGESDYKRTVGYDCAIAMAEWKDQQLDIAIDKALERNGQFLKDGKITQYGFDIAYVTIRNIRELLKNI